MSKESREFERFWEEGYGFDNYGPPPQEARAAFAAGRALGRREMKGETVAAAKDILHRARREGQVIILEDMIDTIEAIPED